MPSDRYTLTVTFPWWAKHYITALCWYAKTFGLEPDPDKVARMLIRYAKIGR